MTNPHPSIALGPPPAHKAHPLAGHYAEVGPRTVHRAWAPPADLHHIAPAAVNASLGQDHAADQQCCPPSPTPSVASTCAPSVLGRAQWAPLRAAESLPSTPLDEVWDALAAAQSVQLDDQASGYTVSVAHELDWCSDTATPAGCFGDLARHVAKLASLHDAVAAILQYNTAKARIDPHVNPATLERIADRLVAVLNELTYAARPRARVARVRYLAPTLAADRPFTVFALFADVAERLGGREQPEGDPAGRNLDALLAKLPIGVAEWVALRNAVVGVVERVRCAHEIYL